MGLFPVDATPKQRVGLGILYVFVLFIFTSGPISMLLDPKDIYAKAPVTYFSKPEGFIHCNATGYNSKTYQYAAYDIDITHVSGIMFRDAANGEKHFIANGGFCDITFFNENG